MFLCYDLLLLNITFLFLPQFERVFVEYSPIMISPNLARVNATFI